MRASDGAGRRREAREPRGARRRRRRRGDGASEVFVNSSRAPMPNPRGFRATCRAGAARVPDIGPGARPGRTTVRRGNAASAMGRVGGGRGREVRDGRWGMRRGKGGGVWAGVQVQVHPPPPPGGPEKKYDRDGAPPGGRRDCCSAGAWGLRPDATRLSARDGAMRIAPRRGGGAAASERRARGGRADAARRGPGAIGVAGEAFLRLRANAALSRPVSRAGAGRGAAAHLPQL